MLDGAAMVTEAPAVVRLARVVSLFGSGAKCAAVEGTVVERRIRDRGAGNGYTAARNAIGIA